MNKLTLIFLLAILYCGTSCNNTSESKRRLERLWGVDSIISNDLQGKITQMKAQADTIKDSAFRRKMISYVDTLVSALMKTTARFNADSTIDETYIIMGHAITMHAKWWLIEGEKKLVFKISPEAKETLSGSGKDKITISPQDKKLDTVEIRELTDKKLVIYSKGQFTMNGIAVFRAIGHNAN